MRLDQVRSKQVKRMQMLSSPLRSSPVRSRLLMVALSICGAIITFTAVSKTVGAQSIQPLIVEYREKANGKFEVINDTLTPMAIVLEPKSFSINAEGRGIFRPLDASIHVKLSSSSFRLEPRQSYYVFYKASADQIPAWFTVYASFSPIQPRQGVTVRVMLPHTVYLYQKKPVDKDSIHLQQIEYQEFDKSVSCEITNSGPSLVRVQEVRTTGSKHTVITPGFPLLPGSTRHLSIDWPEKSAPDSVLLHFPRFDVKEPLINHALINQNVINHDLVSHDPSTTQDP